MTVESMVEWLACDGNAGAGHVGEVRQSQPAGFVLLPGKRAPEPNTSFDGAANAGTAFEMAPQHLLEDCDRPDPRCCLEQRHDLRLENVGERIRSAAIPRRLLL